ncbi:putative peptidylprolyl isomerase domain and WD repeat containing 1 isoform 1 [Operophtera brumata]|uniref:Putative peptidylprolyl isomerase domain and WD repeat containing 1 isoform 1 n=1 Tax=Operophtera brumata TaxID=104452 RepID=A0A0L7LRK7_OPEBR|nr:putative peptidylprolyl isomerase domain and WD repeat containing 1 isoform 1 [Operophtera brumata]
MSAEKRPNDEEKPQETEEGDDDGWIGPMPAEAAVPKTKKRKVLEFESLYLENLPSSETYEFSYMHRDIVTHIVVTKTDFVVTASQDGHLKFWKKLIHVFDGTQSSGTPLHTFETLHQSIVATIKYNPVFEVAVSYWTGPKHEYKFPRNVKFASKLDTDLFDFVKNKTYPTALDFSPDGKKMAAISSDRKVRVFNFVSGKLSKVLDESLQRFQESQHQTQQLPNMEFGRRVQTEQGAGREPPAVPGVAASDAAAAQHGVRKKVLDESLQRFQESQHQTQQLHNMEFGRRVQTEQGAGREPPAVPGVAASDAAAAQYGVRKKVRMATERDLDKSESANLANVLFDASGHFLLYCTMLGVKMVNLRTNRCVAMIGKPENLRPLHLALFQNDC